MATDYDLTDRDRAMLAFEDKWPKHTAQKEEAIRDEFAISAPRYLQLLNVLVKRPAALVAEPLLVNRILRKIESNTERRASRIPPPRSNR